ncbi:hypothetical protein M501DRAFT_1020167 [Patellaria atrata CBS 101060]|uniref:AD domain-containing protein n=1 Tax=Patellaria atrata CBS 101060 TaxID=1346257 RepID=A0A9P4S346_9PEZI|nr:hypothetical protein M501DRAFT_1020167 [Patellaria atrata CBS 101060]
MADGKRNPMAGKVATPKVGGQSMDALGADLSRAVGARIKVTFSLANTTLEGTLFAACPTTNLIAINTTPAPPNPSSTLSAQPGDYHIIPVTHIRSFELISLSQESDGGSGFEHAIPAITKVDLDFVRAREAAAVKKLKEKEAMRARGVSKEAQELFEFLLKRLPTRWHDTQIIVNDAVIISQPYTLDACAAPKDKQNSLVQVKKMLEDYYSRRKGPAMNAQHGGKVPQQQNSRVATPIAPRKGG